MPMHILRYIDERVDGAVVGTNGQFIELRSQINNLTNSINSWMEREPEAIAERCERIIDEAIPASPDNPDSTPSEKRKEHRHAHARWMQEMADEMMRWRRIREKVIEWLVLGGIGVVIAAVLRYAIQEGQK